MNASALRFALRRLRRGWRSGELLILALALSVAVAAASAVGWFSARVQAAVTQASANTLGADAVLQGHEPLPAALLVRAREAGLQTAQTTEFPSVVSAGSGPDSSFHLASVKAVTVSYPLRGSLRLAPQPFAPATVAHGAPAAGTVWVDAQLWADLKLAPGANIKLGQRHLRVAAVITQEPDRGTAFDDLSPRLMLNAVDLASTGLISKGSRVDYTLLLAGPQPTVAAAHDWPQAKHYRYRDPHDANRAVVAAVAKAGQFLDVAVLATALLAAAAVALCARQYGLGLLDEAALLKTLGADRGFLRRAYLFQLLILSLLAIMVGAVLGYVGQAALALSALHLLHSALPPPDWQPLWSAAALALILVLGFALPSLLEAVDAPPLRVFQRNLQGRGARRWGVLAVLGFVALLWLQTGRAQLALYVLGGTLLTVAVLAGLSVLLLWLLAPLRRRGGGGIRFGLANLVRRRGASVVQACALGVALLALLLVTVVRGDLLATWQAQLPVDTPNEFLINIQPAQRQPLRQFFSDHQLPAPTLAPMTRARLLSINGHAVQSDPQLGARAQRWINHEFNLSWTASFGDDNHLLKGHWWSAADAGKPWLSVAQAAVKRLHVKLGDVLRLQFAGQPLDLTVHNIRKVDWDRFHPNFVMVTPPGVLDKPSLGAPLQWITSLYLPSHDRDVLRQLVAAFPNVTVFDLDAALTQVRDIIDRIARAAAFIFAFALAAGAVVLLAAIEGTRAERVRETALLRALGAGRRRLLSGLLSEYAALGLLAGTVAAIAAQVLAELLARRVFELSLGPLPLLWVLGPLGGMLLVAGAGWLSLRSTLNTPPRRVLDASRGG